MLAALPLVSWVNHTVPSGEAAMPEGPGLLGVRKIVTTPVDGLRRPTAWGVNRAVNQTCPSAATVMLRGATVVEPSVVGVVVKAPAAASMGPMLLVPGALTSPGWLNQRTGVGHRHRVMTPADVMRAILAGAEVNSVPSVNQRLPSEPLVIAL